jgi:hypothetical protein
MLRLWRRSLARWPRAQGHVHRPSQILAAGPARRLHRHALGDRRDEAGEIGGIRLGRQVSVRSRALEALAEHSLTGRTTRNQLLPDGRRRRLRTRAPPAPRDNPAACTGRSAC